MEEAALLVAMQRIIGGVEVKDDLFGPRPVRLEEQLDEQAFDRGRIMPDLVVAVVGPQWRVLEPVQGALAGERRAVFAPRLELADQSRQHWVMAQLVVVDEILVPQRDPADALHQHGVDGVLHELRRAAIGEASRQAPHQPERPIRSAEQQRPGVRGHLPAVEGSDHLAAVDHFISEQIAATLCRHRGTPLRGVKPLSQKELSPIQSPDAPPSLRNPG